MLSWANVRNSKMKYGMTRACAGEIASFSLSIDIGAVIIPIIMADAKQKRLEKACKGAFYGNGQAQG